MVVRGAFGVGSTGASRLLLRSLLLIDFLLHRFQSSDVRCRPKPDLDISELLYLRCRKLPSLDPFLQGCSRDADCRSSFTSRVSFWTHRLQTIIVFTGMSRPML